MQKKGIKTVIASICAFIGVISFALSFIFPSYIGKPEQAAGVFQEKLEKRLSLLESYARNGQVEAPDDMIVYEYKDCTLTSWANLFPIRNDDLTTGAFSGETEKFRISALNEIGETYKYAEIGYQKYIVRKFPADERTTYILGLHLPGEDKEELLPKGYRITPPDNPSGQTVYVGENAVAVLERTIDSDTDIPNFILMWASYLLLILSSLIWLSEWPDKARFRITMIFNGVITAISYVIGFCFQKGAFTFSPAAFGAGHIIYSVGVFELFNAYIFSICFCITAHLDKRDNDLGGKVGKGRKFSAGMTFLAILVYTHLSLYVITAKANVTLDINNILDLTGHGVFLLLSYLLLLLGLPILLRVVLDKSSGWVKILLSIVVSAYFVSTTAYLRVQNEKSVLERVAPTLAGNRNAELEKKLLQTEKEIEADSLLLKISDNESCDFLADIIQEKYLSDIPGNFTAHVFCGDDIGIVPSMNPFATNVAQDSRFVLIQNNGLPRYQASFRFTNNGKNQFLAISIDEHFGNELTHDFPLLDKYSFARYHNNRLLFSYGKYSYPTFKNENLPDLDGISFRHFSYQVTESDCVIISRPQTDAGNFLISIVSIAMIYIIMMMLMVITSSRPAGHSSRISVFERRMRLSSMSLVVVTAVAIVSVASVFIVQNISEIETESIKRKLAEVQASVQNVLNKNNGINSLEARRMIELLSMDTGTNISFYSISGKLIFRTGYGEYSTKGYRIDKKALDGIIRQNKQYEILLDNENKNVLYRLYAPIADHNNNISGIVCIPYTAIQTYEIERNVISKEMLLLTIVLLLILAAKFASEMIYRRMAAPFDEISRKMKSANLSQPEHIRYFNNDEIKPFVDNYNMMIDRLIANSQQLSQSERNQAWTEMARQIAHEIKNPLTPMKLQIQRLIRLKEMGDKGWIDKFDNAARTMLEHITILAQTADDFSTFSKLYSEEAVDVDIDVLIKTEISMFSGQEDINFDYSGIPGAIVSAPKPQLTRVFVNLFTNSIQAMEGMDDKTVRIRVKEAAQKGFYEISIEDNGHGVPEEYVKKLFTPEFTTKKGGSGLGLAISKSILDTCGAGISYSVSEDLGGACFTICYPIKKSVS